jgi:c-di-GMP-binding flagellar brake protein YcgR
MDESYRSILPWLRPRSESFPWLADVILVLVLLFCFGVLLSHLIRKHRWQHHIWHTFLDNGLERGLNGEQSQLLIRIARQDRMKHPLLLFSSLSAFDRHAGRYAAQHVSRNSARNREIVDEISQIRRVLGFDKLLPEQTMSTTRELEPGQTLMIWPVKGEIKGFSQCVVTHRDDYAITAVPLLREAEKHLNALIPGDKLKVRFRRKKDTEYRFRTEILDTMPETMTISIKHADRLERIQKRDFFRLEVSFHLLLYPAPIKKDQEPISGNGHAKTIIPIKGRVLDISGGGLGILTQDEIQPGDLLEIDPQFQGPFPLASAWCKVVERAKHPLGYRAHLEFVHLPFEQEEELVHMIFQQEAQQVLT